MKRTRISLRRTAPLLRSRMTTVVACVAATAVVVAMAVTANGFPVNHVAANDGGVWLTNDNPGNGFRGTFGELDVPAGQLAYAFGAPGSAPRPTYRLDVLQEGTTVLAVEKDVGAIYPVDSRTGSPDTAAGVTYPVGSALALGGGVAAVLQPATAATPARLWVSHVGSGPLASLAGLDTRANRPLLTIPGGSALAVDQAGDVYVASASTLVTVPNGPAGFGRATRHPLAGGAGPVALTAVGTVPVVLRPATRLVDLPVAGRTATLPVPARTTGALALQQAGPADPSVLVATDSTLVSVPLAGGSPQTLAAVPAGTPAAPVRLDGCAYGAWGGTTSSIAQACESGTRAVGRVTGPAGTAVTVTRPVLRVNHNEVVLNDAATGGAWSLVGHTGQVLTSQDWLAVLNGEQPANSGPPSSSGSTSAHQRRPELHNPTLYARAGRSQILHVLDHDLDPGGSILSIVSVSPASGPGFTAQVTPDTQAIVLTLARGEVAPITLTYEVVDGFGLTASGPVTVVPTTAEKPPVPPTTPTPVRPVASGATVHLQVLGGWRDPENDPLTLVDASVPASDGQVSWTSTGIVTFSAASLPSDTPVTLTYHVTDGRSAPVAGTVGLRVLGRADTTAYPPTGVPDAVRVLVGRPALLAPLANDVFGADPLDPGAKLALAGPVASVAGLHVATDTVAGTLTLTAARTGVFSLQYQARYGSAVAAPTQVLVQAVAPSGTTPPPVTTPQALLLHGQYAATVDVLARDYDPAGGLLTVIGVSAPAGLQATVVGGTSVRVVATTADPPVEQVVTYQVTDGRSAPVAGQLTVMWQPAMAPMPPVVPAAYATVRAGDEVDVPVLAAASDPDGEPVFLLDGGSPDAVVLSAGQPGAAYPDGLGSASLSGGVLRYAAPGGTGLAAPETVTAAYVVTSELGQRTTGNVTFTVVPAHPADPAAPQPAEVDARVAAGGTVTIPIPTTGVDPNGATVTVTGITSAPQLGRVLSYGADSITYQAFPLAPGTSTFAGGTDQFTYRVEDPAGLTAQGVVRVGVDPPAQAQAPVALDHVVVATPGRTVAVDLLAGDIVAPGDQVTVQPLSATDHPVPAGAALTGPGGTTLQVRAPAGAAPTSVGYAITDGTATASVAHVLVYGQPGFVVPPVAADYFPAAPAAGTRTLTVDVLARDSDPGGRAGDLVVVGSPAAGVTVHGGRLTIPVTGHPRAVPYEVRSRATGATAVGVVHVLAPETGPQLVPGRTIHVPANGSTRVDIAAYVTDPGHQVRLTTTTAVSAAPAGGLAAVVDGNATVTLTGQSGYQGPAALTVQVIDTSQLQAAGAHVAMLSIPVVVGRPAPVVRCPSAPVTVVEGGPAVDVPIAAVCQVWTPDGTVAGVTFTEAWAARAPHVTLGWAAGHAGHVLALQAGSNAVGAASGTIRIGVAGAGASAASTLTVDVVAAPPPTATPVDPPPVETGQTATIDMAQYVQSPLAHPQIDVVSVKQTAGAAAPATSSGSVVRISPTRGTHGTLTYVVAVSDQGPNRPDRVVDDTITLQVLDVPGVPGGLQGVPGNGQVALSWSAAAPNGAPVVAYVVSTGGLTRRTAGTAYTWTGLSNGTPYTFTVTAVNQVGTGAPSAPLAVTPRGAPGTPAAVTATTKGAPAGTADVSWSPAAANGATITGYTVFVSPATGGPASRLVPGGSTSLTWTGLDDAVGPYTFTVVAHNSVGSGPLSAPSNAVYAHGVPAAPPAPTAAGQVSTDQTTTTVVVSWPAIADCNDAQPCAGYVVTELRGGTPAATDTTVTPCATGGGLCATFGPITNDGSSYTYTLRAVNREGQTSPASPASSPAVTAVGSPATVTDLVASPADHAIGVTFTVPQPHGAAITAVKYTAEGGGASITGSWSNPGAAGQRVSETISGLQNGTNYSVTVSACNEADQCGAPSGAASADPYGPPGPPTVTGTGGHLSVTFSWSGGGGNGRPVATYELCIVGGSCTDEGTAPGSATFTVKCSTDESADAYVVDTMGQKSATSAPVTATANQCAPPGAPTVAATANGNNITWSWSGGGGSGLPISQYVLCVDGSCANVGANPGSTTRAYQCGQTHSAYAYVVDTAGQKSSGSNTASATTAKCSTSSSGGGSGSGSSQQVSVSWGGRAPASDCGGDTSCTYLEISWSGFSGGSHTITPWFDGGYWGAASAVRSGSSGSLDNYYWAGYCGSSHSVYATVDGVRSNTINTTQHGC